MNDLMPCPFCGGKARRYVSVKNLVHVYCPSSNPCSVHPRTEFFKKQKDADEAWNRRINASKTNEQGIVYGHWIGKPSFGTACCECSVCGAICNVYASAGIPTQKYCYRCGALMLEDKQ